MSKMQFIERVFKDIYGGQIELNVDASERLNVERLIYKLIEPFPQESAQVFRLYYKEQIPLSQIAQIQRTTFDDVEWSLGYALRHLRHPNCTKQFKSYIKIIY